MSDPDTVPLVTIRAEVSMADADACKFTVSRIVHPGGPFFEGRDLGHWSIPKGEMAPGEGLEDVARREFEEETGHPLPAGPLVALGSIRQKGGKIVHAWAAEGDLDPATAVSNTFAIRWPPWRRSLVEYPEIDRVAWFEPDEARRRIKETQAPFVDRLEEALRQA